MGGAVRCVRLARPRGGRHYREPRSIAQAEMSSRFGELPRGASRPAAAEGNPKLARIVARPAGPRRAAGPTVPAAATGAHAVTCRAWRLPRQGAAEQFPPPSPSLLRRVPHHAVSGPGTPPGCWLFPRHPPSPCPSFCRPTPNPLNLQGGPKPNGGLPRLDNGGIICALVDRPRSTRRLLL